MKKIATILLVVTMVVLLTACNDTSQSSNTKETTTQSLTTADSETDTKKVPGEGNVIEEDTDKYTFDEITDSGNVKEGDKGEGEKTLDTVFCISTIPEGLKYDVNVYDHANGNVGSVEINFGKTSTSEGRLLMSTTKGVSSLDDAVNQCIKDRKLDTYKEGKYEIGKEINYNDVIYKPVNFSNENGKESCLVMYYNRIDDAGVYIEIETKNDENNNLDIKDPLVEKLICSLVFK